METLSEKLTEVTAHVGTIKDLRKLEEYISSLPSSLQTNGLLRGLFEKRRLALKNK
jgi:hypothetical protein